MIPRPSLGRATSLSAAAVVAGWRRGWKAVAVGQKLAAATPGAASAAVAAWVTAAAWRKIPPAAGRDSAESSWARVEISSRTLEKVEAADEAVVDVAAVARRFAAAAALVAGP